MCDINTAIYVPRRLQHKSQSANIMCRVDPCKHTVTINLHIVRTQLFDEAGVSPKSQNPFLQSHLFWLNIVLVDFRKINFNLYNEKFVESQKQSLTITYQVLFSNIPPEKLQLRWKNITCIACTNNLFFLFTTFSPRRFRNILLMAINVWNMVLMVGKEGRTQDPGNIPTSLLTENAEIDDGDALRGRNISQRNFQNTH